MDVKEPTKQKCIICKRNMTDSLWLYCWKGKSGSACAECGRDFHAIGYYILDKAQKILEDQGIKIAQTKEKFGRMVLYSESLNKKQSKIIKDLAKEFTKQYPEYEWDFS